MNVIIKDDNAIHKQLIKDMLIQMKVMMNIDFDILIYDDEEDIIHCNKQLNNTINIIDIIDEQNPSVTGVDIAKRIREVNNTTPIIFLTSHDDYLLEAVNNQIRPHAYINKLDPTMETKLYAVFTQILHEQEQNTQQIRLSFSNENGDTIYLLLSDIYLIYTAQDKQKYLHIETYNNTYTVKGLLNQYTNQYPALVQANKSTLVNRTKIQKITKSSNPKNKDILMNFKNNKQVNLCYITRTYRHNF